MVEYELIGLSSLFCFKTAWMVLMNVSFGIKGSLYCSLISSFREGRGSISSSVIVSSMVSEFVADFSSSKMN